MNICKNCKHHLWLRFSGPVCREPSVMKPDIIYGPRMIKAKVARSSRGLCGPAGKLFQPTQWVRTVALFKAIGGFV